MSMTTRRIPILTTTAILGALRRIMPQVVLAHCECARCDAARCFAGGLNQVLVMKRDAGAPLLNRYLHTVFDELAVPADLEAGGDPTLQSIAAIGSARQNRPASVVIRRSLDEPTTSRVSTAANPNDARLHSIGIGELLHSEVRIWSRETFADS
jgi:hypothetical protein